MVHANYIKVRNAHMQFVSSLQHDSSKYYCFTCCCASQTITDNTTESNFPFTLARFPLFVGKLKIFCFDRIYSSRNRRPVCTATATTTSRADRTPTTGPRFAAPCRAKTAPPREICSTICPLARRRRAARSTTNDSPLATLSTTRSSLCLLH